MEERKGVSRKFTKKSDKMLKTKEKPQKKNQGGTTQEIKATIGFCSHRLMKAYSNPPSHLTPRKNAKAGHGKTVHFKHISVLIHWRRGEVGSGD